jgi:hypothetical protein
MKQHMLTHKMNDMYGHCSSGDDESHLSSRSSHLEPPSTESQQIKFAIKLSNTKYNSSENNEDDDDEKIDNTNSSASGGRNGRNFLPLGNGQYNMEKEADIKKWCNKLNEMPENIAAS